MTLITKPVGWFFLRVGADVLIILLVWWIAAASGSAQQISQPRSADSSTATGGTSQTTLAEQLPALSDVRPALPKIEQQPAGEPNKKLLPEQVIFTNETNEIALPGTDSVLSPDGRLIVCIKSIEIPAAESNDEDDTFKNELWLYDTVKRQPRLLLTENPGDMKLRWFHEPRFSSDGRIVYFMADNYSPVTEAVAAVDTVDGTVRYITSGNAFYIVRKDPDWKDYLVVLRHKYFAGGGSYDWYWLVKPDGTEVDPVGESIESFSKNYKIE